MRRSACFCIKIFLLFGLLHSRNAQKTFRDQGIIQAVLPCLKRNQSETFIRSKTFLSRVYVIDRTCFEKLFLFNAILKALFLYEFIVAPSFFNHHVTAFFEKSILNGQ